MNKKKIISIFPLAISCLLMACNGGNGNNIQSGNFSSNEPVISEFESSNSSSEEIVINPTTYYASPDGTPMNNGTKESPYDLPVAFSKLQAGDTLILLDGTYKSSIRFRAEEGRNGTKEHPITIKAENEGKAIVDFSSMIFNSNNRGFQIDGNWWVLYGLVVKGAGDNGIYIGGHHNLIERCETYECKDSGIQLGRASALHTKIDTWPSYNTILNCTSHDNSDPTGEDADGFACKLTTGVGNVFKGCIAYNNIDDGWDLYTKADSGQIGAVLLEDCVAFANGVSSTGFGLESSDGNGFKLGGESISVPHIVKNCMAFNNLSHGFTDNSNPGTIWLENCTSFNNSIRDTDSNNIDMCRDKEVTKGNYFKNILSYSTGEHIEVTPYVKEMTNSRDQYFGNANHCVFFSGLTTLKIDKIDSCDYESEQYRGEPFIPSMSPFISTEVPSIEFDELGNPIFDFNYLRDENGHVDMGDFLKVNPESEFYTMGYEGKPLGAILG